jgi:hypothetical protein
MGGSAEIDDELTDEGVQLVHVKSGSLYRTHLICSSF